MYKSLKAPFVSGLLQCKPPVVTPVCLHPSCFRAGVWSWESASHPADRRNSSSHHHNRHEIPFCFPQSVSFTLHLKPVDTEKHVEMSLFVLFSLYITFLLGKNQTLNVYSQVKRQDTKIHGQKQPAVYCHVCLQCLRSYLCARKLMPRCSSIPVLL